MTASTYKYSMLLFLPKMTGNSSFKFKWLEKPEYKCLSQTQNKFKAASCNVCTKDINISNIGGRVDVSHI